MVDKITLEKLEKFLGQKGKKHIQRNGKIYYEFACPFCKKIGKDPDNNHLKFYEKGLWLRCYGDKCHSKKLFELLQECFEGGKDGIL